MKLLFQLAVALALARCLVAQSTSGASALAAQEQTVQKATAAWRTVARDLDTRVARMLPCDPKAQQAIEEASRASQARVIALANYYQTTAIIATTRTEGAKRLLTLEKARSAAAADFATEAKETIAAAEQQAADLDGEAAKQGALGGALAALRQAVGMTQQRATTAKDQETRYPALLAALTKLVEAYEAREKALSEAIRAFDTERTRWNAYYAARLARAQLECTATNPAIAPAPAKPKPGTAKAKPKAKAKAIVTKTGATP